MVDWRDFLVLNNGEYIVQDCKVLGRPDVFVLTNQRLIYLEGQREFVRTKSYKLKDEFPLESIKDIAQKGGIFSRRETTIHTDKNKHVFNPVRLCSGHPMNKSPFEYFRETVLTHIKERRQELQRKKPVIIDFSFLKTYIEKGGIVLTTLKCPHCSAPIKMPKDGTEIVCEHCGSTVYAQDIFEKVKKLIE